MGNIQNIITDQNISRVSLDLQNKGYTVYRVLGNPKEPALYVKEHSAFIAVKTGRSRKDDSAYCPHKVPYDYDILALVVGDKIIYNDWYEMAKEKE